LVVTLNLLFGLIKTENMKKILLTLFLLFTVLCSTYSQTKISKAEFDQFQSISQEKIYVHYNSSFLLTGEKLLYKIYCLNSKTNNKSNLSKVAYVEVINDKKESINKQKVLLKDGLGQGDLFLKTNLKSGNYKVIAYTEWMKNRNVYFEGNIAIINPFVQKISSNKNEPILKKENNNSNTDLISINKKSFNKREKVVLEFNKVLSGNYSISVKTLDPTFFTKKTTLNYLNKNFDIDNPINPKHDSIFLPEFRGELIQGRIVSESAIQEVKNLSIGLSIIQKNGLFKITNTNKNGEFYFNISEPYSANKMTLQVLEDKNLSNYKIKVLKNSSPNYLNSTFSKVKTNQDIDSIIDVRSNFNQIENAFSLIKKDSIFNRECLNTLKENQLITYNLDDYTRFKTIKETMTEVINGCWVNKNNNQYSFNLRKRNSGVIYYNLPLLIVDGFIINNHNDVININTSTINRISLDYKIFKYNSKIYEGIIYIETYKGNYTPSTINNLFSEKLFKPLAFKKYFKQSYAKQKSPRVPDYRTQLFWEPNINLTEKDITFFTSDVTGHFEAVLEGFTDDGKPIYEKVIFTVK